MTMWRVSCRVLKDDVSRCLYGRREFYVVVLYVQILRRKVYVVSFCDGNTTSKT